MNWIVTSKVSLCASCVIHCCSHCRRSALHICASSAHYLECVNVLVEHGAKVRLADCNGVRPIDLEKVFMSYCYSVLCLHRVVISVVCYCCFS